MKYLSLFSGIGTGEQGIEQAYENSQRRTSSTEHGHLPNADSGGRQERGRDEQHPLHSDQSDRQRGERTRSSKCSLLDGNSPGGSGDARQGNKSFAINIGYAEIDKTASAIYRYHWSEHNNLGDATKIVCDDLADFDFLIAGFPCQSFSIAGKRQGFNEARGTLFFEIARILSHKRPRHFLLENVKGLLSSNDGKDFPAILRILSDLNYRVETIVLNSKHFNVPQNRERVFFIGHLGDECEREILSFGDGDEQIIRQGYVEPVAGTISTKNQSGQCQFDASTTLIVDEDNGIMQLNDPTHSNNRVYAEGGTSPALNTAQGGNRQPFVAIPVLTPARPTKRQNGRRFKAEGDDAFTLTAQDQHGVMVQMETANCVTPDAYLTRGERNRDENSNSVLTSMADRRIRRLTPIECERLQGCPDGFTQYGRYGDEIKEMSDTARYKGLGNSFTVNVIEAIVTRMIEKGCLEKELG